MSELSDLERAESLAIAPVRKAIVEATEGWRGSVELPQVLSGTIGAFSSSYEPLADALTLATDAMVRYSLQALQSARSEALRAAEPILDPQLEIMISPVSMSEAKENARQAAIVLQQAGETARRAIPRVMQWLVANGTTPDLAARLVYESIGLDERYQRAVANFYDGMIDQGISPSVAMRRAMAYERKLRRVRAETIARTELMRAANRTQYDTWVAAQQSGYTMPGWRRMWILTRDERLCPLCQAMAGKTAPIDRPFPDGTLYPPKHARCRCTTAIVTAPGQETAQLREYPMYPKLPMNPLDYQ